MKKIFVLILLMWGMTLSLIPAELEVTRQLVERAGTYYAGRYYDEAIAILERLHRKDPDSGLVKIFLAHCYFSKGYEAFWPWKKDEWAYKGITLMNDAVTKNPHSIFIRLEHFKGLTWLPSHYKTAELGFRDMPILLEQIDFLDFESLKTEFDLWDAFMQFKPYKPNEQWLKVFLKQMIYCHAGDKYYAMGNNESARIMMEEAEKLGTDLFYGIYASSWLVQHGYKDTKTN